MRPTLPDRQVITSIFAYWGKLPFGGYLYRLSEEEGTMEHWISIVGETLIAAWIAALVIGLLTYRFQRKKGGPRPIAKPLLRTIIIGTVFSLIGTVQRLGEQGILAGTLKWFLILITFAFAGKQGAASLPGAQG